MAATSDVLFPETLAPAIGGYSRDPIAGATAVVDDLDTGVVQTHRRRADLMQFKYRTRIAKTIAEIQTYQDFADLCGVGDVNFTFYEPQSFRYASLLVGLTDGTDAIIVPWRGIGSWTSFLVDGSTVDYGVNGEFVDPTKESQIVFLTVSPPAGQEMVFQNAFARRRYICYMASWRMSPAYGGATNIISAGDGTFPSPVYPQVFEFQFRERR